SNGQETSSPPPDYRKPRLRPALAEAELLEVGPDLGPGRLDGLDAPALSEGVVQFLLGHPSRPVRARLLVADAHQEQPTARLQHRRHPLDIAAAVLVAEAVEEAAVDHVIEPLAPVLERQGVPDQEGRLHASLGCLALGPTDRFLDEVDARDRAAPAGEVQ